MIGNVSIVRTTNGWMINTDMHFSNSPNAIMASYVAETQKSLLEIIKKLTDEKK